MEPWGKKCLLWAPFQPLIVVIWLNIKLFRNIQLLNFDTGPLYKTGDDASSADIVL